MELSRPTQITISGEVRNDQFSGSVGDIYLYWRDSREAALARQGRHANFGYPGYFLASIFDGKRWRKLQLNKLVEYEQRSYELAGQRSAVIENISHIISRWRGIDAIYASETRSFTIPGKEIE
ncbi:hypothetical protein [Delftia acidovorans]|uniref:Uncharacterized protein n=1 Tax=Delftia acidovorans TaxID=80866 RepID=A0AAJ2VDX1_DELAC|nr:hypothetical protein [Delftia acidovorans]MDX4955302.1 hypothetical protein [Delftia acidovorans]